MFDVRWKQSAVNELAAIWNQSDSVMRKAITSATHQIDLELAKNAANAGESRAGINRVVFVFPLGIQFQCDEQSAVAHVLQVWSFRKRG